MNVDEARAQFPVLDRDRVPERGLDGPARAGDDRRDGRPPARRPRARAAAAARTSTRCSRCGSACARASARAICVPAASVALTGSTTDGCNIVLAGLGLGADDEVVTTDSEHFGLLGRAACVRAPGSASRGSAIVQPEQALRRDPCRDRPAHAAARPLARLLADRERAPGRGAPRGDGSADARRRRPERRGGAGRCVPVRLLHRLGPEVALRPRLDRSAVRARAGRLAVAMPDVLLPGRARRDRQLHAEGRAPRGSTRAGCRPGVARRARGGPRHDSALGLHHSADIAARCWTRLAERFRVVTAPGQATLVSFSVGGDASAEAARLLRAGRRRQGHAGHRLAARVLRLVDLGRRPRPPARRAPVVAGRRHPLKNGAPSRPIHES